MESKRHGQYIRIGGEMTWPFPDEQCLEDLCETLTYNPNPPRNKLLYARSVVMAYLNLIDSTQKRRNAICKALKETT